jgi:hypothetical protein
MQTILAACAGSTRERGPVNAHVACYMLALAGCLWPEHLNAQAQATSPQEYRTTADHKPFSKAISSVCPGKKAQSSGSSFQLAGWAVGITTPATSLCTWYRASSS